MDGGCEKWGGPKVSWKLNDPPGYVIGLVLKSSESVFSVYLSCVERAVACVECMHLNLYASSVESLNTQYLSYLCVLMLCNTAISFVVTDSLVNLQYLDVCYILVLALFLCVTYGLTPRGYLVKMLKRKKVKALGHFDQAISDKMTLHFAYYLTVLNFQH